MRSEKPASQRRANEENGGAKIVLMVMIWSGGILDLLCRY